jgi:protein O-mannosyl-transferase
MGTDRLRYIVPAVLLVLTALIFSGVINLDWLNWDDDRYVYENQMVMDGDYAAIFTTPVSGNYNPLPIAMFAWELQQVGDWAWFYHFNNWWLHLLCTALVYGLLLRLGLKPVWAGLAALVWAIHPLRVESVAWITERKDVLFGTFYVGALLAWMRFRANGRTATYLFCMVLFALALFSKIQAVSLPLSMLAIDYYQRRQWSLRILLEKAPFFLGSLAMGIVGWLALEDVGALQMEEFGWMERIVLGMSSFCTYAVKAIVPHEFSLLYAYPEALGVWHIVGTLGAVALVVGAILLRNRAREWTFGLLFFAVNIMFVLQIVGAGNAYLADRFTYIPSIGLYFAVMMGLQRLLQSQPSFRIPATAIAIMWAACLGYATFRYIPAWRDSETIWTDVISKEPNAFFAYVNRGHCIMLPGKRDPEALADFNKAIELEPESYFGYLNRGDLFFNNRWNDSLAIVDYTTVINLLTPGDKLTAHQIAIRAQALGSRGATYARDGRHQEALEDFNRALELYPEEHELLDSRGLVYMHLGDLEKSMTDLNAAITLSPQEGMYYMHRAQVFKALGNVEAAMVDEKTAEGLWH